MCRAAAFLCRDVYVLLNEPLERAVMNALQNPEEWKSVAAAGEHPGS
jgi:hypothetical protein